MLKGENKMTDSKTKLYVLTIENGLGMTRGRAVIAEGLEQAIEAVSSLTTNLPEPRIVEVTTYDLEAFMRNESKSQSTRVDITINPETGRVSRQYDVDPFSGRRSGKIYDVLQPLGQKLKM